MTPPSAAPLRGLLIEPERRLTFTFDGRVISALAGQSIAAALYAAGVRIFSRSFKYHRPRGLFCVAGDCPNCLMQVDGRPNVRTCVEPVRDGQVVQHQNAWPSLGFDALSIFDKLDRFLPVGFYYKQFHKPRWLWPLFEHTVRHIAGLGRVDLHAAPSRDAAVEHRQVEVCVVGGGPAGLAAARAAAEAGAGVLLLERRGRLGGHLIDEGQTDAAVDALVPGGGKIPETIEILLNTTAFGLYEGNLLGAFQGDRLLKIRAREIIVCTGGREQPFLFHNNDLPGIFLGRGVLRLGHLYGVRAGQRAVVVTDNDGGARLAEQLHTLGIEVAAVVDRRPEGERTDRSWPILSPAVVLAAHGRKHLTGVRVARLDSGGVLVPGSEQNLSCDLLCVASRPAPANELLQQGGLRFRQDGGQWRPDGRVSGLWAAGAAAGTLDLRQQIQEGRACGLAAAGQAGEPFQPEPVSTICSYYCPQSDEGERKRFVCLCEDVTEKDIHQAVGEGFDHIETLKRYSTFGMGPCQGKVCGRLAAEVCARTTGREAAAVGMTTSRPPVVPVELGVLAAGQRHHPIRRTPLHHGHAAHGARWMDVGQWKRPESYGDPTAEVRAVRNGVGLIDVSTLGKIELIGPDAAELMERVYLNRWGDLKAGRVRYGVMCTEEGILFDDGVAARLAPDRFYLTATTGNADVVAGWLELWRATWRLDVAVLSQTAAFAAMNLAGPRSREVLARLTRLDVSPEAFPYLAFREGEVAGVPCRVLRIGFVGELGYEIHCPSGYAWHLWEALVSAGKEFGLQPFGVEAQRVLRLEKGHLIIGQDTDASSNPLEAGLDGLVRFDKPLFHGREPLLKLKTMGPRSRLVGFQMVDSSRVPPEGCQVVEQGVPVGRVTSARFSPTLQRPLGLAWVPAQSAAPGSRFLIRMDGVDVAAVVSPLPFYDPEAKRLRG